MEVDESTWKHWYKTSAEISESQTLFIIRFSFQSFGSDLMSTSMDFLSNFFVSFVFRNRGTNLIKFKHQLNKFQSWIKQATASYSTTQVLLPDSWLDVLMCWQMPIIRRKKKRERKKKQQMISMINQSTFSSDMVKNYLNVAAKHPQIRPGGRVWTALTFVQ